MDYAEQLKDLNKRERRAAKWKARFKKIFDHTNLNYSTFSTRYKLEPTILSRHVNGKVVPTWESIFITERSLEKEEKKIVKKKQKLVA